MVRTMMMMVAGAVMLVPAAALACGGQGQSTMASKVGAEAPASAEVTTCADTLAYKVVSVDQVAALTKEKKVSVVDANGEKTREKYGVIPGAILLTSASQYDPSKELPAKGNSLVFYCANERCTAAKTAAKKALEAGWTDVAVLPAGIMGWVSGGQKTSKAMI